MIQRLAIILLAAFACSAVAGQGRQVVEQGAYSPLDMATCAKQAEAESGVPASLLLAVSWKESGGRWESGIVGHNRDGSVDRGPLQVNSAWWDAWLKERGVQPEQVAADPCTGMRAGALVLAWHLDRFGLPEALVRYHYAGERGRAYAIDVLNRWEAILETGRLYGSADRMYGTVLVSFETEEGKP